jgi:ankyrin repeat protein
MMNTNSMHVAARRPAPFGHREPKRNGGNRAARNNGGTRVGLLLLFSAIVVTVAGQVRADAYEDFNRAVATDDARTVTRLLERGMDPNTVNEKGEPALMTAAREGAPAVVKALIRARVKVNLRNGFGDTPIMIASLNGNLAVVKLLREAGAEINQPGWTPLQYAAVNGHDAVIEYLLSTGADMALTAPNGVTPLMLAVLENKADTVKLLISYGFDVSARNDKGETALGWARRREFKEIEQILRKAGAKE